MDVDRSTDEAIEMVSQGARLTTNLINFIFKSLADRLENNKENTIIDGTTQEGKQKINNLLRKHKDGIQSIDENLTKEQVKGYQKELKKLGVDFSVVKNSKDNYSFFFASSQAGVMEKALRNVAELKSTVLNDEKVKESQLDLDSEMNNLTDEEKENVVNAFDKYLEDETLPEKETLNEREQLAFDKMKEHNEIEKEVTEEIVIKLEKKELDPPTEKQLALAEKLGIENADKMSKKEVSIALENNGAEQSFFNKKEDSKEILQDRISKLSDSELKLFEKRMEYENESTAPVVDTKRTGELASELKDLQKNHSKESVHKVNNLDKEIRDLDNSSTVSKGNRLNANEILRETKGHVSERKSEVKNENKKEFSLDNVKVLDKKIKEESKDKDKVKHKEQSR